MLSVSVIGAGGEASGYANYQESEVASAREDYYAAEGDAGRWTGRGAQEMGLAGDLKPGQLLAGLQGFHPETGEALSKNAGEKHKGGWDLTFSAPKSVSCIWAVANPETRTAMESAQNAAAARALAFLEESGAFLSRSRNESAPVEGVAAAMYQHGTSREADPQLHTHVAVLNVQPDGTAMDFDTRWKMAAGAVYRCELAAAMQKLGFQVEADGKSFRVAGVPEAVEKEFSTRRAQIKEALAEKGLKSAKAAEVAALSTRKSKEPTTRQELFADWQTRAAAHGLDQETVQALRDTPEHELQYDADPLSGLAPFINVINEAKEQNHERPDRYATDPERIRAGRLAALRESDPGKVGLEPPPQALNRLRGLSELGMVHVADRSEVLLPGHVPHNMEHQRAERPDQLRRGGDGEHGQGREELDHDEILSNLTQQASTFTPQQMAAAVATEMQGKGGADAIQKTLRDLQKHPDLIRLESEKPHHLRRGEPTEIRYTTREMLEIEQGILDKCLARQGEEKHRVDTSAAIAARPTITQEQIDALRHVCEAPGAVKVVEGMAGTGKSYMLGAAREAWEAAGFEVIGTALAGKAAAGLQEGAGITSQTGHSLLWQLDRGERELTSKSILVIDEAGMMGSRQLARLLDYAHKAGAKVVPVGDRDQLPPIDAGGAFRLVSERLGAAWMKNIVRQKNADTVIEDRQVVKQFASGQAAEALHTLRERGLLRLTETRAQAMQEMFRDWSQARDPSKPGESIMLAATRAEVAQLNAMARQGLKATGHLAGGLQVPTAGGMKEFAPGDRIIFGKNDGAVGVSNGHLATIQNIKFDRAGQVEITALHDNGQTIQFTVGEGKGQFDSFDHGYAMTVHKSQSVTVDRVFALPSDSMSSLEWAYVAMSRHRIEARLYATHDSIETLTKTMSRAQGKDTSLDYKLAQPEKPTTPEKSAAVEKTAAPELATSHDLAAVDTNPSTHSAESAVNVADSKVGGLESALSGTTDAAAKARLLAKIEHATQDRAHAARHHGQQEMAGWSKAVEQKIEACEIKKAEQQELSI